MEVNITSNNILYMVESGAAIKQYKIPGHKLLFEDTITTPQPYNGIMITYLLTDIFTNKIPKLSEFGIWLTWK